MNRSFPWIAAVAAVGLVATSVDPLFGAPTAPGDDPNTAPSGQLAAPLQLGQASQGLADDVVAVAVFPGPAGSFGISLTVTNFGPAEVTEVIVDSFFALGGEGLLLETAAVSGIPPAGSVFEEYPVSAGRGPVVLSCTGFDPGESITFSMDPDTWDDPSFGATVGDMAGTTVKLVFADGTKAFGICTARSTGDTTTRLHQTYP